MNPLPKSFEEWFKSQDTSGWTGMDMGRAAWNAALASREGEPSADGLLSCPFCGGTDVKPMALYTNGFAMTCISCRSSTAICQDVDSASIAWNTRAYTSRQPEIDALREEVERLNKALNQAMSISGIRFEPDSTEFIVARGGVKIHVNTALFLAEHMESKRRSQ